MKLREPPKIDFLRCDDYSWPCHKFGLEPEDLFSKLFEKYNYIQIPLQNPNLFHLEVQEIATKASTPDEFYCTLKDRANQRYEEIHGALDEILTTLTCSISRFPTMGLYEAFLTFARSMAASDLPVFFSALHDTLRDSDRTPSLAQIPIISTAVSDNLANSDQTTPAKKPPKCPKRRQSKSKQHSKNARHRRMRETRSTGQEDGPVASRTRLQKQRVATGRVMKPG
ncbi:hypothetical protein BX600DRAFT_72357 [Xylariales sp. PMI_506]|nr:hypothetical protein BX600DRAFT_72357 [Xylariales sp. PMI_506]